MKYKLTLFTILASFLFGCATPNTLEERIRQNISCNTIPASAPPDWVFGEIKGSTNYYYGSGVSDGFGINFNEMRKRSRSYAEADLSSSIESRITSSLRKEINSTLQGKSKSFDSNLNQVLASNSQLLLENVEVEDTWFNHRNCQLWTKVRLSKENMNNAKSRIKTMTLLKVEETSQDVKSIKKTIESDPNVILRKYGLTLSETNYLKAIKLDINKKEHFKVLDLYGTYGYTTNSKVNALGIWVVEPFIQPYMNMNSHKNSYLLIGPSILQFLATLDINKSYLSTLANYHKTRNYSEIPGQVRYTKGYESWFKKKQEELRKKESQIYEKYSRKEKAINNRLLGNIRNIGKEKADNIFRKEMNDLKKNKKVELNQYEIEQEKIFGSPQQQTNAMKFDDKFYAIHFAACFGSAKNLSILEDNGFSLHKQTEKGYSPADIARHCNNNNTLKYLDRI